MATDKDLIEAVALKKESAFKALYNKYWKLFYSWCFKKVKEEEDIADILQNFWIWIWNNPEKIKFDAEHGCKNYLLHLLTYRIIDFYRQQQRKDIPEEELVLDTLMNEITYNDILNTLHYSELQDTITKCVQKLAPGLQDIYRLRYEEQLSISEAAKILKLGEGTVRNRSSIVLQHLRRELADENWL